MNRKCRTENDEVKMQDLKMQYQMTNGGPNDRGSGKCRTKMRKRKLEHQHRADGYVT